jgi:hypothetical protein
MVIRQPELIRRTLAALAAAGGLFVFAPAVSAAVPELALPAKVEGGFIFRFADISGREPARPAHLAVTPEGQPTMLINRRLIGLKDKDERVPYAWTPPGNQPLDGYAWMADGTFLAVSGARLGMPKEGGFDVLLELPEADMRIAPAGPDLIYLFGGTTEEQRRSIYLYARGGRLLHLVELDLPVAAVAGNGILTFFATGNAIYRLMPTEGTGLVYEANDEIRSLAVAGTGGLFYGTPSGAGFVRGPGQGLVFLRGVPAEVSVYRDDLFIHVPEMGVLKIAPLSSFDSVSTSAPGPTGR